MRKSNHAKIRALLNQHPDGLTIKEIKQATGHHEDSVRRLISAMPDVYCDRWQVGRSAKKMEAVYIAVPIPEDCPYPTKKQ